MCAAGAHVHSPGPAHFLSSLPPVPAAAAASAPFPVPLLPLRRQRSSFWSHSYSTYILFPKQSLLYRVLVPIKAGPGGVALSRLKNRKNDSRRRVVDIDVFELPLNRYGKVARPRAL